ncbi:hypothetical protein BDV95DRAFT_33336 [Massariosphaeria phaeospora]|uniref:Uncharacterized protein n=1 Tax=Massariosphaeria phaeospora TaxID=100035 RepID=A0A7C8I8K8_9PLEO|nr:hypothetical protein BDV95DRAFT_33336 [Massariosphaeria phaeospora]
MMNTYISVHVGAVWSQRRIVMFSTVVAALPARWSVCGKMQVMGMGERGCDMAAAILVRIPMRPPVATNGTPAMHWSSGRRANWRMQSAARVLCLCMGEGCGCWRWWWMSRKPALGAPFHARRCIIAPSVRRSRDRVGVLLTAFPPAIEQQIIAHSPSPSPSSSSALGRPASDSLLQRARLPARPPPCSADSRRRRPASPPSAEQARCPLPSPRPHTLRRPNQGSLLG